LYYGSRIPWLLVGNTLYNLFDPLTANIMLRFLLFYVGVSSIYAAVYFAWQHRGAALLAAVILGTYSYFLYSIHWDYLDGPVVVTSCVALALIALAGRARERRPAMLAAGFTAGAKVSMHIFQVFLMPALAVWYLGTNVASLEGSRARLKRLAFDALFIAAGVILCYLLCAFISRHM